MTGIDAGDGILDFGIHVLGWLGGIAKARGDYDGVGFWYCVYAANATNTTNAANTAPDTPADSDTAHDACLGSIANNPETYPNSIATDPGAYEYHRMRG